ncbi:MAG: SDR family oxidoreductase [Magnetococcales bacterium]|nr:SDR family oxidoreductase [Magnetococcales bacterium]
MKNPVIVVTGGGRGIGAAVAILAARKGYAVCVNYLVDEVSASKVVETIKSQGGVAIGVQADISDQAQVTNLFNEVESSLGQISALVNNAGLSGGRHSLTELDDDVLTRVLDVNVRGTFLCAKEALRCMVQSGTKGGIVNISSQTARFGGNLLSHYAASKAAVETFTLSLSREAATHGIRVNVVSPGIIENKRLAEENREELIKTIPLGRIGTTHDVAQSVLWLLSEQASYITGVVLPVAGGR